MGGLMSPLEPLAPDQRAVVALVLQQGRSYDEIASLLGIPVEAVRARAHAGLAALVPGNGLPGEITAPLADYLLGQQPPADAEATRGLLAESAPAREWASGVASSLDGVAPNGLPEIPAAPPPAKRAKPAAGAASGDDAAVPAPRPRPVRDAPAATAPDAAPPASRLGGVVLIAGVLVVVAVVLFLVLRGDGDDDGAKQPAAAGTPTPTATATATATPQVTDQITLKGAAGSKITGQMTVYLQGGKLLFQLQATGVPASAANSAYAVWFTNPGGQAHRLGFTTPVGSDGKLGIIGPSDKDLAGFPKLYATYRTVVVARAIHDPDR
jgi:hypothetical protein